MQVTMQHAERLTLAEMREFVAASNNLSFAGTGRKQIYCPASAGTGEKRSAVKL